MGETNKTKSLNSSGSSYTEFFYKAFRNILLVSVPLLVMCAIILSSSSSQAEPSHINKDQVSLSILPSCTLSVDQSASTPHTVSILNGTYESDIGKTRVVAFCNDANGYNIYAIGYTNNEDGNTKLIGRSLNVNGGLLGNEYDINTGTAISGNTSNWAMKLTGGTGADAPVVRPMYTDYAAVPNNLTMVAHRESGTHMSSSDAIGAYFDTTYRAYVTSSQPAGTYNGQVKYVLDHPYSSDPLYDIEDAYYAFGNEKVYLMNDGTVHREMPTEEHGGLAGRYYAMQDMSNPICSAVEILGDDGATQLVDMRDGKLYWTAKLKDEHCWMTQNLDLDLSANNTLNSITTDLNVTYDSSTGQYAEYNTGYTESNGIIYWTPADTATTINFQNTGPIAGWQSSYTEPYSANKSDSTETGHASLGNYYNWTVAIASNNSSPLTQDTLSNISKNPKNSICPKGWRLPTISNQSSATTGSTNEFARLNYLYNDSSTTNGKKLLEAPIYIVRAGLISDSLFGYGTEGNCWSSTNGGVNDAHYANVLIGRVSVDTNYMKPRGRGVRCLVK